MSLRTDLESGEPLRQAAAMMQLLNAMAGEREVGTAITVACQALARGAKGVSLNAVVRKLVYDVIRGAALSDSDWENAVTGFLEDYGPTSANPELQVAALSILPCLPPHKLKTILIPEVKLLSTLTRQLRSANKEVAAAAIEAVGRLVGNRSLSACLARVKDISDTVKQWALSLVESMCDASAHVSATAFQATWQVLDSSVIETSEDGDGGEDLQRIMAIHLSQRAVKVLPTVLWSGKHLHPEVQANVVHAMMGLLQTVMKCPEALPKLSSQAGAGALMSMESDSPVTSQHESPSALQLVGQVAGYIEGFMSSNFAPLAYDAAKTLLSICQLVKEQDRLHSVATFDLQSRVPVAFDVLVRLWNQEGSLLRATHSAQILETLSLALQSLPIGGHCLEAAKKLLKMAGSVPLASTRILVLARTWAAVVGLDLHTRAARRAGEPGPPAVELQLLLSHPAVAEAISATGDGEALDLANPAYKEELVCTLMEVLLSHPQSAIRSLKVQETDDEADTSILATIKAAARVQHAGDLVDWLGAARIALQGTKACLGWDREPSGGTFACTTVTDSWLMLLQKSLQAAKALQAAPVSPEETGTVAQAAQVAVSYIGSFQELLDQLLMHWQALSAAVQPRALWIAAHHYELAPSMESGWAHLLQALSTSLGVQADESKRRRRQALKSAAALGQMQPANDAEEGEGYAHPIDEAEIHSEAMAVGLIAADRLASLLLHNSEVGPRPGLKAISAAMLAILQQLGAPKSSAGPESRERAARIAAFLTPLATAPAPTAEQGEAITVQTEFGAKLFPSPNWPLDEGFPMAGPAGATLQATKRGKRYWILRSKVQQAVSQALGLAKSSQKPSSDITEAPGLIEVMDMISNTEEMGPGFQLTAPNDPLSLTIWHKLDWNGGRLSLLFEASNDLQRSINGATIRLGLGGPMIPEAKQPPAYKLATLPAGETCSWRFSVRLTGFGRVSVQPFITLPSQLPKEQGDDLSLRCERFELPLTVLLARAEAVSAPHTFFQTWPSYAAGVEVNGVCRNKGAIGGLQALSALQAGPFSQVMFQPLPAQGGFQAAYEGRILGGMRIALVISGQLLHIGLPPPRLGPLKRVAIGHVVCRMSVRSTDSSVTTAIQQDLPSFIREVFRRTLVEGVHADGLLGPAAPFKLDQSFIPIERLYNRQTESSQIEDAHENGEETLKEQDTLAPPVKDTKAVVEDAITQEWLRIRSQRLAFAS